MSEWWRASLNPEGLSQGDVLGDVPFGTSISPPESLIKVSAKHNETHWARARGTEKPPLHFLYKGSFFNALVVSHSCELDKGQKARVLVAPVKSIASLSDRKHADAILAQKKISLFALPNIPGLEDSYADLRLISAVDVTLTERRLASMTDDAVNRLQAQLVQFFTRIDEKIV